MRAHPLALALDRLDMAHEADEVGLDADLFGEFARRRLLQRLADLDRATGQRERAAPSAPGRRGIRRSTPPGSAAPDRAGLLARLEALVARSRKQPPPRPARRAADETHAIMQAEGAVGPQFGFLRFEPEAAPIGRAGNLAGAEFFVIFGGQRLQRGARLQRPRLLARPGADLRQARAGVEIEIARRLVDAADGAAKPRLPAQRFPVEQRRRLRLRLDLAALGALGIGVEHQAAGLDALAQHHARV